MLTKESLAQYTELMGTPALPGLRFRRFRGADDYPAIVAIINAANRADGRDQSRDVESIANDYKHLSNCDPQRDIVFAEIDDQAVAYARVAWFQEENGPRVYYVIGYVHPQWRRRGIGRAMLRAGERRLRDSAAEHDFTGQRMVQLWATDANIGLKALAGSEGYAPVRYDYDMVRPDLDDLPAYKLPEGLEIRPVMPDQYRAIWEADQEAFRDHWGYSPSTEDDYRRWLNWTHFEPGLWKIAWDGDQVAGQVRSFINRKENEEFSRKRGYTEFISVRRPWRRHGLARALIVESFHELKRRGMTEAALGVDAENPNGALRVYKDCGFRVVMTSYTYRKPLD